MLDQQSEIKEGLCWAIYSLESDLMTVMHRKMSLPGGALVSTAFLVVSAAIDHKLNK